MAMAGPAAGIRYVRYGCFVGTSKRDKEKHGARTGGRP
jgi:hypothetical protein